MKWFYLYDWFSDSGLGETERINHINWNMNNESSCAALETEENCKMR